MPPDPERRNRIYSLQLDDEKNAEKQAQQIIKSLREKEEGFICICYLANSVPVDVIKLAKELVEKDELLQNSVSFFPVGGRSAKGKVSRAKIDSDLSLIEERLHKNWHIIRIENQEPAKHGQRHFAKKMKRLEEEGVEREEFKKVENIKAEAITKALSLVPTQDLKGDYKKLSKAGHSNPAFLAFYHRAKNVGRLGWKGKRRNTQLSSFRAALQDFLESEKNSNDVEIFHEKLKRIHDKIDLNEWNVMESGMKSLCEKYMRILEKEYPNLAPQKNAEKSGLSQSRDSKHKK